MPESHMASVLKADTLSRVSRVSVRGAGSVRLAAAACTALWHQHLRTTSFCTVCLGGQTEVGKQPAINYLRRSREPFSSLRSQMPHRKFMGRVFD